MIHDTWSALYGWFDRVPIDDPIERRNAPFLQLVLTIIGTLMFINLLIYLRWVGLFPEQGTSAGITHVLTDSVTILAAWTGVFLIRRGRLRLAVALFLVATLGSLAVTFALQGVNELVVVDPTFPVLGLVLSGLILGRRALWIVFGCAIGTLALGVIGDIMRSAGVPHHFPYAPTLVFHVGLLYLMIAIVLDRTIAALHGSLTESARQKEALIETNRLLREEMAGRERAREQLIHAQKMEAVGRIASGVAHDFNNVLNVVLGFASRRERIAKDGTSALVEALAGVDLAARRALSINRKLLNFGRQDLSKPETFDAIDALWELQPMLRQLFDDNVRMLLNTTDTAMPVHIDHGQFELIILNIAANARDAMPEGGQFTVVAQRADDAPMLEIALCDTGKGIPEAACAHVFDPFFTTKPVGSGTGLGLAMTRDMVMASHGSIDVESVLDEGTVFRVRLPLAGTA